MSIPQDIINRAASLVGIRRANDDLEPYESEAGLDSLQDFLVERQIAGIKFPIMYPKELDSEMDEPDWTRSYIKTQLAIRLAAEFTKPVSAELIKMAKDAKNAVYKKLSWDLSMAFPDILPIGAGNRQYGDTWPSYFPDGYTGALKTSEGEVIVDNQGNTIFMRDVPFNNIITGG